MSCAMMVIQTTEMGVLRHVKYRRTIDALKILTDFQCATILQINCRYNRGTISQNSSNAVLDLLF